MRLRETLPLLRVARPPAPYGARRLARCHSIEDVAGKARRRLPLGARAYLDGGGGDEYTLRRNRAAFDELEFLPAMPRDSAHMDTSTTLLGRRTPLPFALAPIGSPRMFHHQGERAVARAARHAGIPYALSTLATTSIEDVAAETDTPLWFRARATPPRSLICVGCWKSPGCSARTRTWRASLTPAHARCRSRSASRRS